MDNEQKAAIQARLHPTDPSRCAEPLDIDEARSLLDALDQCEQDRNKFKFVLSFGEFAARQKIFDLLASGVLRLTPDRKLVGR